MGKVYVKGGTPIGSESLCASCTSAHIMTGYKESEAITMCSGVHPNIVVPFRIYECTGYYDKNKPSYREMQKLAIHVSPDNAKKVGFKVGAGFGETTVKVVEDEGDEEGDAS